MHHQSEFDKALDHLQRGDRPPFGAIDAAIQAHEALKLAWASVREVFGKDAKPEHAVAVMQAMVARHSAIKAKDRADIDDEA